jgi:hypothetical protein
LFDLYFKFAKDVIAYILKIQILNEEAVSLEFGPSTTLEQVRAIVCLQKNLDPTKHSFRRNNTGPPLPLHLTMAKLDINSIQLTGNYHFLIGL